MSNLNPPGDGPLATPPPEASRVPSLLERFVALFSSPPRAFRAPLTLQTWLLPLVFLAVVQVGHAVLLRDLYIDVQRERIEASERMTDEQKEAFLDRLEQVPKSLPIQLVQGLASTAIGWAIQFLIPAVLYLLGLNFILGAQVRFRDVFAVTVLSAMVYVVRELIRTPLMAAQGSIHVYTGPAALVSAGDRKLVYGLQLLDLFELYRLYLLAVGFGVLTGLPLRRTAYPVLIVWLLYGLVGFGCVASPLGEFMP